MKSPSVQPNPLKELNTAKYYCTLSLAKYQRPDPFAPANFVPTTIFKLPLPIELRDETKAAYNSATLEAVGDLINTGGSPITAEILRRSGDIASGAIGGLASGLGAAAGNQSIGERAGSIAQQALKAENITTAIQQSLGKAPNPNPTVAFLGPELRELSLTWTFMPATREDARNVRNLIKRLKRAALPGVGYSPSILGYPEVCQVNFFPWDAKGGGKWGWGEDSIIKMKQCFMSNVLVDYTSGSAAAFFHGDNNEPVVTRLTVSFKEIEYFLGIDYGYDQASYGKDDDGKSIYNIPGQGEVSEEEYLKWLDSQSQPPPGDDPNNSDVDETEGATV
jgi:hypothetical protein